VNFYETTPLIEESILRQYFHLSQEDKRFILTFYGTLNRTSIAIQLCLLRYLGYIPQDWQNQISSLTIQFLIEQISIQNTEAFFLKDYARWGKTRTDHLQQILKYLNFRKWQPIDEPFILPKYFGYGKGVTFYTHTSDQYSQYGSKVISSTERDATYVLDEILTNETDLDIMQHTTDTHGYSDLIFALFDLVDKQFAPRIRDIKNQRLYY
jgi:TnpA family transposase